MSWSLAGKHCAAVGAGRCCGPAVDEAGCGSSHGGTSVGGHFVGGDFVGGHFGGVEVEGGEVGDGDFGDGEADVAVGADVDGGSLTATSAEGRMDFGRCSPEIQSLYRCSGERAFNGFLTVPSIVYAGSQL